MPHPLSAAAILEKNKLSSDGAWLVLLEILLDGVAPIYLVRNNEDISWNGREWVAFPFEPDDIVEDGKGEIPELTIRVSNVTREAQRYIEEAQAAADIEGASVIIRVIMSNNLDITTPEAELPFELLSVDSDEAWVYFHVGCGDPQNQRYPRDRYLKDFCPFVYGGEECGVSDAVIALLPTCNRSLSACRIRVNALRFRGIAALQQNGIYVS